MDAAPTTTTEPIQKEHCAENPASRILTLEKSKQPISPDEVRRTIGMIKGLLRTLEQQLLALEK